ncbi:hypothetical protein [Luteibaculum oceani]|uniref:Ethylene receptor 1-like N-terminal domain-containing protein n=1 Tax=Luteibaculum oceani TaxID=1294296 RepID=A0A5C6USA1_9FLAO|nr:hypothetical protein [Luteibaculum oceani]TXC76203.1 hypothetical protein FRX97_10655 [Luteibaculum oceani]
MNQIAEFFSKLFSTESWPPRWRCGDWTAFEGWVQIISDLFIWLAYFLIPVVLVLIIRNRPSFRFTPLVWLFAAFIVSCGLTHLMDAIVFWHPMYRLMGLLKLVTAITSLLTLVYLIKDLHLLLPDLGKDQDSVTIPSEEYKRLKNTSKQLKDENEVLKEIIKGYKDA